MKEFMEGLAKCYKNDFAFAIVNIHSKVINILVVRSLALQCL